MAESKSFKLNFHCSFKPEVQHISSLLLHLDECNGKNKEMISSLTGIPTGKSSGKVEPTIQYCEYMGLLEKNKSKGEYQLIRTALGEKIEEEDIGCIENLTLLTLHSMLVRRYNGAVLWAFIFHEMFPKYHGRLSQNQFIKEVELKFGKNVDLAPFKMSYEGIFQPLNLLSQSKDEIRLIPQPVMEENAYLYGLMLFTCWDEWLEKEAEKIAQTASTEEITADQLNETGFKNLFGWSDSQQLQALELVSSRNLIVINRQMNPYSIRRTAGTEKAIENLYSELL